MSRKNNFSYLLMITVDRKRYQSCENLCFVNYLNDFCKPSDVKSIIICCDGKVFMYLMDLQTILCGRFFAIYIADIMISSE